ncbi:MAG: exbB [Rickettsiales bacterium]|jgi:biopolymer transport protein TolQ|nr:exbB [Rickettsiales bacterium]
MTASTATIAVETAGAVAAGAPDLSILGLIGHADIIVKLVLLLLLLSSFICWGIIFSKFMLFRKLNQGTEKFEKVFWSGQLLDHLYERVRERANHPMAAIFVAAMSEWRHKSNEPSHGNTALRAGIKERIFQAMQVARNRSMEELEGKLSFLATVGSSAPFIGLFGTVWGIMNSFQSIAASKNTTLAVVAPGIAEALFATAVGLFAAIPAVIFYNFFTVRVNRYTVKLEDFSNELSSLLSRELDNSR